MIGFDTATGITMQRVTFRNHEGENLIGDLYLPENNPKMGVVFGHCFTCSRHTRVLIESCEELYKNGIAALRFDFSGNGQSEGGFTETTYSKHINEMVLAVELLKHYGIEKIGLAGHSMGAAISLLTAAQLPDVSAICTLAGRYSGLDISGLLGGSYKEQLQQTGQMKFTSRGRSLALTNSFFEDIKKYDLASVVSNLKQPLLAVHGDKDEITPISEVYYSKRQKPEDTEIAVIKDADHMFSQEEHRQDVADLLTNWFKKHLSH